LEVWRKLGLADKIEDAMLVDQAGSAVLEELIVNQQVENTRELILTASWYIWWMRRQLVHGEKVPTSSIVAISIRVITTNNIRAIGKNPKTRRVHGQKRKKNMLWSMSMQVSIQKFLQVKLERSLEMTMGDLLLHVMF
jgi:hypothetical protein